MKLIYFLYFFIFYAFKVIDAGLGVSYQILKGSRGDDGIVVKYHPSVKKKWQIVLLFNLISMTPGSMSIDIDENDNTILVHLLNRKDRTEFIRVTQKIEQFLSKAL
ncbi:Na+/H+ antiporter subunit E [Thermophagus xiamenensis]|uniref:Multicomponent K+:H+ antiporter subunit E/multicomponent Na+:H+ antiporter subunit E n=1 Tax=Thermophagus xiamenensis TaxID=385682 RepID=A0A1I2BPU9_9BACT|nr:Na+/H+ antiporter subunit E [Thermophagus xiamenensis]SFE58166.1 multicomponent K+:H+ antiporter subunit E/multicomponent Na+:H+ antiporter subunit E [Thermophagus xiamenensis]